MTIGEVQFVTLSTKRFAVRDSGDCLHVFRRPTAPVTIDAETKAARKEALAIKRTPTCLTEADVKASAAAETARRVKRDRRRINNAAKLAVSKRFANKTNAQLINQQTADDLTDGQVVRKYVKCTFCGTKQLRTEDGNGVELSANYICLLGDDDSETPFCDETCMDNQDCVVTAGVN
jgi:hypothetical protein